ncbi:MAG: NAD(P)-binding protein [Rhodoferax sp.]|nr:NAD(P)-binding protein [Rhodoferax sp.]MDP3653604.1 NAD(P)-binding protein [Rhodoferax sp.]
MESISRRDILGGIAWIGAGSIGWPLEAMAQAERGAAFYPPSLTGLRGSHPGAFEAAHVRAWSGQQDHGPLAAPAQSYDLVVVGGGISGLAAAHFYRQTVQRDARILILDNHDDFGGHAKRNEFQVDGTRLLSYGGTQSIDTPADYSAVALGLLKDLGIDLERLRSSYDLQFFKRYGLTLGVFYDQASFGRAALLQSGRPTRQTAAYYASHYVPGLAEAPEFVQQIDAAPLTKAQRAKLREVLDAGAKAQAFFKGKNGRERLESLSYVQYLDQAFGIKDPALIALLSMPLAEEAALGGSALPLSGALSGGLLGFPATLLRDMAGDDDGDEEDEKEDGDEREGYVYHFPDGGATIARLLVQRLIPEVARFDTPEQCLSARFDYDQLDRAEHPVQVRLNSLAVQVANTDQGTQVNYLRQGKHLQARARHTVMAGWHMMGAHIITGLPERQKAAMRANLKMPLVYVQVALRQWKPLQSSGVAAAYCPGAYFQFVQMDFPVGMGSYRPTRTPDAPTTLLLIRMPCPLQGKGSTEDLLRQGRAELLGVPFEHYEAQVRAQLSAMYGPFGFDGARDIAAITVNRWPHGYVYEDAMYDGEPAHLLARKRHGRIAMANADSAGSAYTNAAIDMAWRAVQELKALG